MFLCGQINPRLQWKNHPGGNLSYLFFSHIDVIKLKFDLEGNQDLFNLIYLFIAWL